MSAVNGNGGGRVATEEAAQLLRTDLTPLIASMGYARMISRAMIQSMIGEFDPERIGVRRLYNMRRDPMIQMGLHYLKAPLIGASWHIECEDAQIAGALTEMIKKPYAHILKVGLNKFDFGYQGAIKQFKLGQLDSTYEGPNGEQLPVWPETNIQPVVLKGLIPIPPEYATVNLDPTTGEYLGFRTSLAGPLSPSNDDKTVPSDFSLWWTNEFEENFRNYYGYPRTGYAFRYWWSYWFRHHMQDRHFEQDADPPLQVNYPVGNYMDPNTGEVYTNKEIALELGEDLRGGATIAVPSDFYTDEEGRQVPVKKWELAFVKGGDNMKTFLDSANYLEIMKLRSILIPEQALVQGQDQPSSRAVQAGYADIFKEAEAQEAADIDSLFNHHVIPQLLEANWGPDAPRARKVTTGFDDDSIQLAQDLIKLAFQVDPNSIPLDFRQLVKDANLPILSVEDQQRREAEAAAQQAAAQPPAPSDPNQPPTGDGSQDDPSQQQLSARITPGRNADITKDGRYINKREVINLSAHNDESRAVFARRQASVHAVESRLRTVTSRRYKLQFDRAAQFVRDINSLGLATATAQQPQQQPSGRLRRLAEVLIGAKAASDTANATEAVSAAPVTSAITSTQALAQLLSALATTLRQESAHYDEPLTGELASMYHAVGLAQLQRLGLDTGSWDVGRIDVQEWARDNAARLVTSMDQTVVEQVLAPFLHQELAVDFDPDSVADKLSEKFENYPHWMSERVARTESRTGYNQASLDMWERVGLSQVVAYDGFGGKSGKTDPHCLERNGTTMDIPTAREEDESEHPNGTLCFDAVVTAGAQPLAAVNLSQQPLQSETVYAVTDGRILTELETGALLAGD